MALNSLTKFSDFLLNFLVVVEGSGFYYVAVGVEVDLLHIGKTLWDLVR